MLVWGRGGRWLDGLSGMLEGGCDTVMVRVGDGLEKGLWKKLEGVGRGGQRKRRWC